MLLVKSRELKNLNNKNPLISLSAGLWSLFLYMASLPVYAQNADQNSLSKTSDGVLSVGSFISIFLSLLLVIAIIFALAYVMRRFNVAQAGNGQMKIIASMMTGQKEKVIVIEVGDQQFMLGVTAHNINHLATLESPIQTNKHTLSKDINSENTQVNFQQKLVQAMAAGITGKINSTNTEKTAPNSSIKKDDNHEK